jgi:hypothetical protein
MPDTTLSRCIIIDVVTPYTGTGTGTLSVTAKGFTTNWDFNDLNLTINPAIIGKRVIYFDPVTGTQSGDTLAA